MPIPFKEPISNKYIDVDEYNLVNLIVPITGGQEISTDNTCESDRVLKDFFDGEAIRELESYRKYLEYDIALLNKADPTHDKKKERLKQINCYLHALQNMRYTYAHAIKGLLRRPSNLHSIQLRPKQADSESIVINPTFSIERGISKEGEPLSPLYNAMHEIFPNVTEITCKYNPREQLIASTLAALPPKPSFEDIQYQLGEMSKALFNLNINFNKDKFAEVVNKNYVDEIMAFGNTISSEDYIKTLINICALDLSESIGESSENPSPSLFYRLNKYQKKDEMVDNLSILTQFLLGHINIHCKARGISHENFGKILDSSPELSNDLIVSIKEALLEGDNVEQLVCNFLNCHNTEFGMNQPLNMDDLIAIKSKFDRNYRIITASPKPSPMDDFMVLAALDLDVVDNSNIFFPYKGNICVNFAEIVEPVLPDQEYYERLRHNFKLNHGHNDSIVGEVEVDLKKLINMSDEQFAELPKEAQEILALDPKYQLRSFLYAVAQGKPDEAEKIIRSQPLESRQELLCSSGDFEDPAGRKFTACTALKYAYWAKDSRMCNMLLSNMGEDNKELALKCIQDLELHGLIYKHHGEKIRSFHFDLTPLIISLHKYTSNYLEINWKEVNKCWMEVGKAQHELPTHIAQEYCQQGEGICFFSPETYPFENTDFHRTLKFLNQKSGKLEIWPTSSTPGLTELGNTIAIHRGANAVAQGTMYGSVIEATRDLAAIRELDEIRTEQLASLKASLKHPSVSRSYSYFSSG